MSKLLKLTGADSYTSPLTYGQGLRRDQVILVRESDAVALLGQYISSPAGRVAAFTAVTGVTHHFDFTNKYLDYTSRATFRTVNADQIPVTPPYIPRGVELRDETGVPYGFSDGVGGVIATPNAEELRNERSTALAEKLTPSQLLAVDRISNDRESAAFLQKATFGGTLAEIQALTTLGSKALWMRDQLSRELVKRYMDRGFIDLAQTDLTTFSATTQVDTAILTAFSQDPAALRVKCTWAMAKLFIISLPGGAFDDYGTFYAYVSWFDRLDKYVFGNFRDWLESMTYSVHMSRMLTYYGNQKGNDAGTTQPDENYARELMQLFTIGLYQLNLDGTYKLDSSGNKIPTYTNDDIRQVARCLTGLTRDDRADDFYYTQSANNDAIAVVQYQTAAGPSLFANQDARLRHYLPFYEYGSKQALGGALDIPAGTDPVTNLSMLHDALFNHPNVAPFFATRMIQHLVTSNPSPEYVGRVAAAFEDNGFGVRGDLQAVWSAILLDREAASDGRFSSTFGRARDSFDAYMAAMRPLARVNSAGHTVVADTGNPFTYAAEFGNTSPRMAPSIFGAYDPLYSPPSFTERGLLAPEIMSWSDVIICRAHNKLMNIAVTGELRDTPGPWTWISDYSMFDLTGTAAALADRLDILLCGGHMSVGLRASLLTLIGSMPVSTTTEQQDRMAVALQLVTNSSDYMVQL